MSFLGQKACILGPTIFKIPQPNWYQCRAPLIRTNRKHFQTISLDQWIIIGMIRKITCFVYLRKRQKCSALDISTNLVDRGRQFVNLSLNIICNTMWKFVQILLQFQNWGNNFFNPGAKMVQSIRMDISTCHTGQKVVLKEEKESRLYCKNCFNFKLGEINSSTQA